METIKTFFHIYEKLNSALDVISVFLVLSAAKDLLLALREEVLWEDPCGERGV